jgi:hypothetical protein
MKTYLLTIGLLVFNLLAYSQNIYQIRADSVRIYNDCDTAELIIENHTQMVPGYLYNKGRGRTEFRRTRLIDLGLGFIAIGDQDTIDLGNVLKGNFIQNQYSVPQPANFWVKGAGRIDSAVTLSTFKNNETEDSVLTTDIDGNLKFKVAGGGGGVNIYNSDGDLEGDRIVGQGNFPLEFKYGSKFLASGTYLNFPYRFGTYFDYGENQGLTMEYGGNGNRIAVENDIIRIRSANYYYQMMLSNDGTYILSASLEKSRIGLNWGDYSMTPMDDVSLEVIGGSAGKGFKMRDGSQGLGKVLTSDANGFSRWETPGASASVSDVLTVTGSYTLTPTNHTLLVNNPSACSVFLPSAAANNGRVYFVKKLSGTNANVQISPSNGTDLIEGISGYLMTTANKCVQLQSNGISWYILSVF